MSSESKEKVTPPRCHIVSAAELKVGDPIMESTNLGPLIRNTEVERVDKWVVESKKMVQNYY